MTLQSLCAGMLITLCATIAHAQPRAMSMPRDTFVALMSRLSNAGRWGAQDQLGTLNRITPAKRRAAARSVRDGVSLSLARDLVRGPDSNAIRPMSFALSVNRFDSTTAAAIDSFTLLAHGYAYSHIDALAHFLFHGLMYNGVARDQLSREGAKKLGIEAMRGGIVALAAFERAIDAREAAVIMVVSRPEVYGLRNLQGDPRYATLTERVIPHGRAVP